MPTNVPARSPEGEDYLIPPESVQDARDHGWLVSDPHEGLAQQTGALAEGVAQGAIPGAPQIEAALLPKAGSIEEQNARRRAGIGNAVGNLVGQGLQFGAVSALTGGLGDLGEGASAATKAAQAVREGATASEAVAAAGATPAAIEAAANAAAKQAPRTLSEALAQGRYGSSALAGGVGGGTQYTNEAELGDHRFNAEALIHEIGLGAAFGVAGEGAYNVLKETAAPAVLRQVRKVTDSLGSAAKSAMASVLEMANPEAKGLVGPALEAAMAGARKTQDSAVRATAEHLEGMLGKLGDLSSELYENYHPAEAKRLLQDVTPGQIRPGLLDLRVKMEEALSGMEARAEELKAGGVGVDRQPIAKARLAVDEFDKVLGNPDASSYDLQRAAVDLRRGIDEGAGWKRVASPDNLGFVRELRENLRAPVRDALNDPAIFGPEMAARNQALDGAYASLANAKKNVYRDLGMVEFNEWGAREQGISAGKLRKALNGDPLSMQDKLRHIDELVGASNRYGDEVSKSAATAGAMNPGGKDLESYLQAITAQRRASASVAPLGNLQRAVTGQQPGGAAFLGLGLHALGVPSPIAGAAYLARNPVAAVNVYAKLTGAAARASSAINSGVKRIFESGAGRAAVVNGARGLGRDFTTQAENVNKLAADPRIRTDALTENLSLLMTHAPVSALAAQTTAHTAISVLHDALPKNPVPSALESDNKNWKPSGDQLYKWNQIHQAVTNPPLFLQAVADGTASPDAWNALQAASPGYASAIQQAVTKYVTEHSSAKMTQGQRSAVSMIIGSPISPTVAVDQIQFSQASYVPPPPIAPAGGTPKLNKHGLEKFNLGRDLDPGHHNSR